MTVLMGDKATMTQTMADHFDGDSPDSGMDVSSFELSQRSAARMSMDQEFDEFFLSESNLDEHLVAVSKMLGALTRHAAKGPYSGSTPAELAAMLIDVDPFPGVGIAPEEMERDLELIVRNSILLTHPRSIGHLLGPPVIPALQAEVLISALNQSLDVFETSPVATIFEQTLIARICREFGLPTSADGTFTPGGTHSNYAALLLARDYWLEQNLGWSAKRSGLPACARDFRILCSDAAHFSVEKAAAQLGLGTDAVIRVPVDDRHRIRTDSLAEEIDLLRRDGKIPIAIVATAGTTDFGAIDDLTACAGIATDAGIWLHVDAAYGGGLAFSQRYRARLDGIESADSISVDFHKMLWQPASCGLLLLGDSARFSLITHRADYLNPVENKVAGIPDLVDKSLMTTRRFDALKVWLSLRTLGKRRIDDMIGHVLDLAQRAAGMIGADDRLEMLHRPELGCLVFRYVPEADYISDVVHRQIQQALMAGGRAMIATTRVRGKACLKLTLLSPLVRDQDLRTLIREISDIGRKLETDLLVSGHSDGTRVNERS
jgi:L-2,4-diaminobutyrate decarboxylase